MPQLFVGVFGIGILLALGAYAYSRRREYRNYENHYRRNASPPPSTRPRGRNLVCPICGQRITRNSYELDCGHQFHRICYADKLLAAKDAGGFLDIPCPFCVGTDDDVPRGGASAGVGINVGVSGGEGRYSSESLTNTRRRVQLECGHYDSECSSLPGTTRKCRDCLKNPIGSKCSVCTMPIQSNTSFKERGCGHFTHDSCSCLHQIVNCLECAQ
ncbi:uncharacterized protein [Fopius arisanus]|uniref:RING-type domain-containing protein n=1 Tax=Fopius arisanus TaxID=64838 RepID=A0A9R1SZX1_9HYME|nr:PREDICTED: uncharacterized protein LOC105264868 [Fopius arisanus]